MFDSAINSASKRTILTQECLRRLRNTKVELGEDIRNIHLNNFMLKLKNSGYSKKYRMEILRSALLAFDKMLEDNKNNVKPLFRKRSWNKEEREAMKVNKKVNWYKNAAKGITYRSVLFVPPTPGGVLAKELRKREEELNNAMKKELKLLKRVVLK